MSEPKPLNGKRIGMLPRVTPAAYKESGGLFYFTDVKSACEFYMRYADEPELLIEEHSEYAKNKINIIDNDGEIIATEPLKKYVEKIKTFEYGLWRDNLDYFNRWLFQLTFKDAIGKIKKHERMSGKEEKDFVPLLERVFLMEDLKTKKPIPIIFKSDVIECLKGLEKRKIMVKGSNYAVLWKDIKNIFGEVE